MMSDAVFHGFFYAAKSVFTRYASMGNVYWTHVRKWFLDDKQDTAREVSRRCV